MEVYRNSQVTNDREKNVKETEIKLLTADKATQDEALKKNKIIIYSGSALTILLLLFAVFIFRNNRQKQKVNKELVSKNTLIESQKKEVETQKEIVEEKQKEILDSISYAETRYVNAHVDYKTHAAGGPYIEHLSRLPGYPEGVYKDINGDGVIELHDNNIHHVKVIVKDSIKTFPK